MSILVISRTAAVLAMALVEAALPAAPVRAQDAGPYAPTSIPLRVEKVGDQPIHFSVASTGVPGSVNEGNTSNAGFVITSDGVVVFDALGTPSLGWALLREIRKLTDKPVKYVVVSHYHADHIYGLQAFKDHTSALIVAHERALEYDENDETADERASERLRQRRAALSPWVDRNTRIVKPDIVFKERMTISLGEKRFVLRSAGPAHAASDILMLVEPDRVLFAGDIVQNGRIPFMNSDDVDTASWLRAFDEVTAARPSFVIPGHGMPSADVKQAIEFTRTYINYVRNSLRPAVAGWLDFEQAYRDVDWSSYQSLPAFGDNNRGNAYRIFLELEREQLRGAP